MLTRLKRLSVVVIIFFTLSACTNKPTERIYTMGYTPAENAETVTTNAKVIADIVEKKTGIKIKTYVATDYTALIQSLKGGTVDFAWLAAFGYVLAEKHAGAKVLLKSVRKGKPHFYSAIIVRSDSPFKKIQDLKGKNIAWVDPASASGYIVPKASLLNENIEADKFFNKQIFAGGHDTVVLGVINKSVDAGATFTNEENGETGSWTQLTHTKPEFKKMLRVIYVSKPIPNDTFATTNKFYDANTELVNKITDVIKGLDKSEEGKTALRDLYRIDALIKAENSDYEPLRKAAAKIDIGTSK